MNKALTSLISHKLQHLSLPLCIQLDTGDCFGPSNAPVSLHIHRLSALKHLAQGHIGKLASDIVEGRADLHGKMRDVMAVATELLAKSPVQAHNTWWARFFKYSHTLGHHSLPQDAAHIRFHYDVSDDFYALWLDPRRIYSCAYYRDEHMDLAAAQAAKLDLICRKLYLQADEQVLDIGCGWGGFLIYAAEQYGIWGTGITLSHNQYAYAQALIAQKGLQERITF